MHLGFGLLLGDGLESKETEEQREQYAEHGDWVKMIQLCCAPVALISTCQRAASDERAMRVNERRNGIVLMVVCLSVPWHVASVFPLIHYEHYLA